MILLYRKLLGKILLFGAILLTLSVGIEYILYRNTQNDFYIRQADWHLKHPHPIQVLFLGNSRTAKNINLPLIINRWNTPMYLLGLSGGRMDGFWYKFKVFASRNVLPKTIVLQFDPIALVNHNLNEDTLRNKERFLSYLFLDNIGINQWLSKQYGYESYDAYIPLVRYIPYPELFRMHLFKKSIEPYRSAYEFHDNIKHKEEPAVFMPLEFYQSYFLNRKLTFQYADSFYQFCQQHKVQLIGVFPPQTRESYDYMTAYRVTMDSFLQSHPNFLFKDFNTPEFAHRSLFIDHMHLNLKGADLYTTKMEQWLSAIGVRSRTSPDSLVWNSD